MFSSDSESPAASQDFDLSSVKTLQSRSTQVPFAEDSTADSSGSHIYELMSSIKRRSQAQRREMKERNIEELRSLSKKYQQVKKQLRVQQELMNSRASAERLLQDQLGKATMELGQLRVLRDDLNSSSKQATSQIQILTRELEQIRTATSQIEQDRQRELIETKKQLSFVTEQLEQTKYESQLQSDRSAMEKGELESQLLAARTQIEESQDEIFRLTSQSRGGAARFESEMAESLRNQQKLSEMRLRYERANGLNAKLVEENDKLRKLYADDHYRVETIATDLDRISQEKSRFETEIATLTEELREKATLLKQAEARNQKYEVKIEGLTSELQQTQKLLVQARQSASAEIESLTQQLTREQTGSQGAREDRRVVIAKLERQTRELQREKALRDKAELNEQALKQRINQAESVIAEIEAERIQLNQQLREQQEEIHVKNELIEASDKTISELTSDNFLQTERSKALTIKIQSIEHVLGKNSSDLEQKLADALESNSQLNERLLVQQKRNQELESSLKELKRECDSDQKSLAELHELLLKERGQLRLGIQERKEIQRKNKAMRQELAQHKRELSQVKSELSLSQAENSQLTELVNDFQSKFSESAQGQAEYSRRYLEVTDKLREEKASHAVLAADLESSRSELLKLQTQIDDLKLSKSQAHTKSSELTRELKATKHSLAKEFQALEGLKQKVADLTETNQQITEQLQVEQEQKEQAVVRCTSLGSEVNSLRLRLEQLGGEHSDAKSQLSERTRLLTESQHQVQ
jgi:chromosome segregation ATPase